MSVRILKARMTRLDRIPGLDRCTFVWDETDELAGDAIFDLVRNGEVIEDDDTIVPTTRFAHRMAAPAQMQ
jgi:hypothetical protein